jgi:beta-lactamase class A
MVLPGVVEALEANDEGRARAQVELVVDAVRRNRARLASAASDLEAPFDPSSQSLEAKLHAIRRDFDGDMAIYAENLRTGEVVALDADSVYETFSVIKVAIMAEVMRRVEAGALSLSTRIPLDVGDPRIPSGVLYALDPGLEPTVRDWLTLMIIVSDNAATDKLAELVGYDSVTAFMRELGLSRTEIRFSDLDWDREWLGALDPDYGDASGEETLGFPFERYSGAEVSDAFRRVIEETPLFFGRSTAREIGRLFTMMARGELVSESASEIMISILERQQVDHRFPRYLGDGVRIAHKTGDGSPWVGNDAGILWIRDEPVVLVAFTGHHRGTTDELNDAVARVAKTVADHYTR